MAILARSYTVKPARRQVLIDRLAPRARPLWRDCALAWPFWSFGQGHVEDAGPNRLHGVMGATILPATDWLGSPYGASLRWNGGATDKLTVADPPTNWLDGTTKLSVELIFKTDLLAGAIYGLVGKYRPSNGLRSWRLYIDGDELELQVSADGIANEPQITTNANLVTGTWYHAVVTYDAGVFRAYLNGVQLTTNGDFTSQLSIFGGTEELKVGQRTTAGGSAESSWQGEMASLRIWTGRALTAADAKLLYEDRWAMYDPGLWLPSLAVLHSGSEAAGPWISVGVVAAGVEELVIDGLMNGTSYDVKSETVDITGNRSAGSTPVTATPVASQAGWGGRFNRTLTQQVLRAPRERRGS